METGNQKALSVSTTVQGPSARPRGRLLLLRQDPTHLPTHPHVNPPTLGRQTNASPDPDSVLHREMGLEKAKSPGRRCYEPKEEATSLRTMGLDHPRPQLSLSFHGCDLPTEGYAVPTESTVKKSHSETRLIYNQFRGLWSHVPGTVRS